MVLEEVTSDELNEIFDSSAKEVLNYLLQRCVISYPEFLPSQKDTALYLEKKQCEQWIVQALGLKPVGEGSYPIDGINDNKGYDVSSLALSQSNKGKMNSQTGEKSLGQKFSDENFGESDDNLDSLFGSGNYDKIINAWKKILKKKWLQAIKDHKLENIYLVNLILYKPEKKLYIFLLKINHKNLEDVTKEKISDKSVFLKNFIDKKFGNAKIYKSKKRLELRLKPHQFLKNKSFLEFKIESKVNSKNLREIFQNDKKREQYFLNENKKFQKFFNLKN